MFNSFIEDTALRKIKRVGGRFTWTNKQRNPVMSNLDRFLVSGECDMTWFPDLPKGSDNYRFGWIRDTPIRLQIQRIEPCNLSTTNPLVIS
jgi:hypothetical protein